MKHVAETAGRIMTTAVPVLERGATVKDGEAKIRSHVSEYETINYLYIIEAQQKLCGVISVRELLSLPPDDAIEQHMCRQLVTARAHTDQERVAHLALKHNLKAIPVVSKDHTFLGVVASDTILSVLNQEHTEDVLRFAGVRRSEAVGGATATLLDSSSLTQVRLRLPWLLIGLVGGVVAAAVVSFFDNILEHQLILAAFIPAIVYMADAVGSQTQMLFIRSLAVDQALSVRRYLRRELQTNFWLGLILSVIAFSLSFVWLQQATLSLILFLSLFLTVWGTVLVAIALPWLFHVNGKDPAIASGPLATVLRDIMSLSIYLGVASVLLI